MVTKEYLKIMSINIIGFSVLASIHFMLVIKSGEALTSNQIYSWPSVEGSITKSEIHAIYGQRRPYDRARIQYKYWVNEKEYVSDNVCPNGTESNVFYYAKDWCKKYPVGKKVLVYYNPEDNSHSYLEADGFWVGFVYISMLGMSCLYLDFKLIIVFVKWVHKKRYQEGQNKGTKQR